MNPQAPAPDAVAGSLGTRRRTLLAAAAATLATPWVARSQAANRLTFVPNADLTVLDPYRTGAYVTRNHALMVYDTLYGLDAGFRPQFQMLAGHDVQPDGLRWTLTLRDGLRFHDGTPVLGRDVVASLRRWGRIDPFGQGLFDAADDLSAPSDRTVEFRLKRPFPLLPAALGKPTPYAPVIMPERIALADPTKPITEVVGSGPFRFLDAERVSGSLAAYAKFTDYVPRPKGSPSFLAGPKQVFIDRVEWRTIPDPATAAAALQTGAVDWWEMPLIDVLPALRKARGVELRVLDPSGYFCMLRLNHLHPPFANPEVRRVVLAAVLQRDFMDAVAGGSDVQTYADTGVFAPASALANDAGRAAAQRLSDPDQAKAALAAAGYKGEKVVFLTTADIPLLKTLSDVGIDRFQRIGLNVDVVTLDWGTMAGRRFDRRPVRDGGWSVFATALQGMDLFDPAGHIALRGNGTGAWAGWPESPDLEALRQDWFAAPDLAAQQAICRRIQEQAFRDVPFIPAGTYVQPTAYRSNLSDMLSGLPLFWNIKRRE